MENGYNNSSFISSNILCLVNTEKAQLKETLLTYPAFSDVFISSVNGTCKSIYLAESQCMGEELLDLLDDQPLKLLFVDVKVKNIPLHVFIKSTPVHMEESEDIKTILNLIERELNSDNLYSQEVLTSAIHMLLLLLVRNWKEQDAGAYDKCMKWIGNKRLCTLLAFIHNNLHQELNFTMLSKQIYLSPDYVGQFFKRYSGLVLQQYIDRQRVLRGFREMVLTSSRLSEVAVNSGFIDQAYFNKRFKKHFQATPLKVRKAYQQMMGNRRLPVSITKPEVTPEMSLN